MAFDTPFLSSEPTTPVSDRRKALTVSELNEYIRMLMEGNPVLRSVWVKGEISNFTNHRSGHLYFSLKDEEGVIRAVMFRASAARLGFIPEEGMKVLLHGKVTLYGKNGQYQINADGMQPDGIGALFIAFEQLKRKLEYEGLFSEEQKKPLPKYPKRIGIITSPTGAAIQDIIQITGRRFPLTELILYPSIVQGSEAARSLCKGLRYFEYEKEHQTDNSVDLIIIGRGGGSMEDLWAFNDEQLARTIASATIPVISAVGHETDFTICDFVADQRAPTPSAAAELAVPDATVLSRQIGNISRHFEGLLLADLDRYRSRLQMLTASKGLLRPSYTIDEKRIRLDRLTDRIDDTIHYGMESRRNDLRHLAERFSALNPLGILARGYSAVSRSDGRICTAASDLSVGDHITLRFADGIRHAKIIEPSLEQTK